MFYIETTLTTISRQDYIMTIKGEYDSNISIEQIVSDYICKHIFITTDNNECVFTKHIESFKINSIIKK